MDALQSVDMRTPIEMVLDIDSEGMTTARKLYEFLELRKGDFARWCKTNITENEFATENEDYVRLFIDAETPTGGKIQREDYKLTAHFAKKLSVKGNGEKSEQAREYFTRLEERVKQKAIDMSQLSPELQMFNKIFQSVATQQLEQKRQAEEIEKIKEQQAVITDTFAIKKDIEDFQRCANGCLAKIAESPNFTNGFSRNMRHQNARAESYPVCRKTPCFSYGECQRILKHLETMMDCEETDVSAISHERLGITRSRLEQILIMLQKEGYIEGIVFAKSVSDDKPHIAEPIKPMITLKGLEYLAENTLLKKAGNMIKGIVEIAK